MIAGLGTCLFIDRQQNVVFQGFTGSGKSYLGCALAKAACLHRVRARYVRMPELRVNEVPEQVRSIQAVGDG
ncbi:ATP-binding protein [Cryobacterium ruanii]|uniref:ATP-binding protein n=1 Tax=Cryobacterium ruanii TaxID=1259197 RepID=UPI00241149DF|nr:ATP-binding protein [Cryobacterium ruanii]